jgi:HK97 family phage major capsid protein
MTITADQLTGMGAGQLRSAIADLEDQALRLHQSEHGELRNLDAAEQAAFDDTLELLAKAREHLRIRAAYERGPASTERAFSQGRTGQVHAFDTAPAEVLAMRPGEARDKALKALEERGRHLAAEQADQMESLLRAQVTRDTPNIDGDYIAKRTLITESDAYRSAFAQVITDPHPVLTGEEAAALRSLRTIVLTGQQPLNPLRQISRTETITTSAWKGVSSAGVTWSFDAEAAEVSDDTPTLAQPTVPVYMARGFVPWSIEVGQDYPRLAEELATLLAEGYDDLLANKLVLGAGTTEPKGVVTALDATAGSEVVLTTAGTFDGVQLNKLWNALPDRARARARWLMSHSVGSDVATLANPQNNASFFTSDLTGVVTTLRTRPVEFTSYMDGPITGAGHKNWMICGDFNRFLIAQRAGLNLEPIQMLFGTTNQRPLGVRGTFAWARVGSDVIDTGAFRLLNQT